MATCILKFSEGETCLWDEECQLQLDLAREKVQVEASHDRSIDDLCAKCGATTWLWQSSCSGILTFYLMAPTTLAVCVSKFFAH